MALTARWPSTSTAVYPSQTIDVAIVRPPTEVAKRLKISKDEPTVVRRRVRSLDGSPYYINDSYSPLSLVNGIATMCQCAGATQHMQLRIRWSD